MHIETQLDTATITQLIRRAGPLRIRVGPRRWVELRAPETVTLIPGRGVRVVCAGRVGWTVRRIPLELGIRVIDVLLIPELAELDGSRVIAFGLRVDEIDLVGVPRFVDRAVARRVNRALGPATTRLVWRFGDALTNRFTLAKNIEPLESFELNVVDGALTISHEGIAFRVDLVPDLERGPLTVEDPTDPGGVLDAGMRLAV